MLTQRGKDYIANNFGKDGCFVSSELNWSYTGIDGTTYSDSGGTAGIITTLVMTIVTRSLTYNNITYTYNTLKSNNDDNDITLDDAKWIAQNDGYPRGEAQYCMSCATPGMSITIT